MIVLIHNNKKIVIWVYYVIEQALISQYKISYMVVYYDTK